MAPFGPNSMEQRRGRERRRRLAVWQAVWAGPWEAWWAGPRGPGGEVGGAGEAFVRFLVAWSELIAHTTGQCRRRLAAWGARPRTGQSGSHLRFENCLTTGRIRSFTFYFSFPFCLYAFQGGSLKLTCDSIIKAKQNDNASSTTPRGRSALRAPPSSSTSLQAHLHRLLLRAAGCAAFAP